MGTKEPIRVLQVVTHMERGGLETMLMNYYRHIDREKVQFDFLVHRSQRAAYDDEIEALGGVIYRLPRLVPWSRSYRKALDAFFAEHKEYQVVHVHQDCLSAIILKAAKKQGIPVRIAHSHNSNQDKNLLYPVKLFYRCWIPKYATQLFACGKDAGDWMFCGAPYTVLNNAIDASAYRYNSVVAKQMRHSLSIPEDALVLGHVGRFSPQKNHEFLIDIFVACCQKVQNAYLLLVGEGGLKTQIEEKVQNLGLQDRVIFTGVRSDVQDLLQAMDVFVFPSLYEGLPVTMVEAQAAGLPCLISDGVPIECKMTELVRQIPLDASPEAWADTIVTVCGERGMDTLGQIQSAGFDVRENARWLQNFYLEKIV